MKLPFEIFFDEERRNAGRGRTSIFRVRAKKNGARSYYRNETFAQRAAAVARFNQLRRILNNGHDERALEALKSLA